MATDPANPTGQSAADFYKQFTGGLSQSGLDPTTYGQQNAGSFADIYNQFKSYNPADFSSLGNQDPYNYKYAPVGNNDMYYNTRNGKPGEGANYTSNWFDLAGQAAMKQQQTNMANEATTPGYQEGVFAPIRNQRLQELAQQAKSTISNLSSRGLGYGGIAQGAQAANAANASGDLAMAKQDVATAGQQEADSIRQQQVSTGLQARDMQQGLYNSVYNSALSSYQAQRQAEGQMLQAGAIGAAVLI